MIVLVLLIIVPSSLSDGFVNSTQCVYGTCPPGCGCELSHNSDYPKSAYCSDACADVICADGDSCTSTTGPCDGISCIPMAYCSPSPCAYTSCPVNTTCNVVYVDCPDRSRKPAAVCGPGPCDSYYCPANESCFYKSSCIGSSSKDPQPYCRNPCDNRGCPPNQACYTVPDHSFQAPSHLVDKCMSPCDPRVNRCRKNETCKILQMGCFTTPCYPKARCVPNSCCSRWTSLPAWGQNFVLFSLVATLVAPTAL